ncbi:HIT family protein [Entomomonas moraniae]|uniref:HIT family protein n=1 Tax=Entomomonas moraniae TaxID=2213226 RepID=A0A3S9XD79_9GAMM|nr:HIT family protein [Entomomonas moraniae]AZS50367.1 HIT family protein [Entomomonas moraniae]
MQISDNLIVFNSKHWVVNHRKDSKLSGYLIMQPICSSANCNSLSIEALKEMGSIIARTEGIIKKICNPQYLYISKYGHTPDTPFHFHFIPVYQWVIDLFWSDERYRELSKFGDPSLSHLTDGAELTFFIWREFCEKELPPKIQGISAQEMIKKIKAEFLSI